MFPDYRTEDRTRFIEIMWHQLVAISCRALTPTFEYLSLTKYLRFQPGCDRQVPFDLAYIITNYLCMTNLFFTERLLVKVQHLVYLLKEELIN